MKILILYSSLSDQSIISKAVAYLKAQKDINALTDTTKAGSIITVKDFATSTVANMLTYCGTTLVDNTYDDIYRCLPVSAGGTNYTTMAYDHVAALDAKLKTAKRGTVVISGAALDSNATATEFIIPAADSPSATEDYYTGMYIKTTETTAVFRYISNYVGTTRTGTINTSTTALTTTEAYVIYTNAHIWACGDASSTKNACRVAWELLFPGVTVNPVISVLGGYGSGFQAHKEYTVTADSFTQTTVLKAAYWTAAVYDSGTYYIGIESATTGAGQTCRIASNTAGVITLGDNGFKTLPTGTLVFQITPGENFLLYDKYLPYAIKTYLAAHTDDNQKVFNEMFDRYNMRYNAATSFRENKAVIDDYAMKGKAIFDAICAGIVS
jgi:hypothetical protein